MASKVLILDTSMLCCWLEVSGKETCGSKGDIWDASRVDVLLKREIRNGSTLVLPLATIIETGNHISQTPTMRHETACKLSDLILKTVERQSPWAAFSDQSALWTSERMRRLAQTWPELAARKISIGDTTIIDVADYYSRSQNFQVEILTGDTGLKAYQPVLKSPQPRRRRR